MRQNHKLERDLAKLDKRIALLIKNRTSLQDVIAASKGLKSQKKNAERAQMEGKQLEVSGALSCSSRCPFADGWTRSTTKTSSTCSRPSPATWLAACT